MRECLALWLLCGLSETAGGGHLCKPLIATSRGKKYDRKKIKCFRLKLIKIARA